jgi:hypothetical protein
MIGTNWSWMSRSISALFFLSKWVMTDDSKHALSLRGVIDHNTKRGLASPPGIV